MVVETLLDFIELEVTVDFQFIIELLKDHVMTVDFWLINDFGETYIQVQFVIVGENVTLFKLSLGLTHYCE